MENCEYAGFWIRLAATLIDTLVLLVVVAVPLTLIYGTEYWLGGTKVLGFWDAFLNYFFPFVATIWFWHRFCGTPGKMALRLRIVDGKTGLPPSVGQSVLRYVGYIASILPLLLGFIWVGIDRRKQGFHDKIAGTVVIRDTSPEPVKFEQST